MISIVELFISVLVTVNAWAGQQPLVTLSDPVGDDFGNGRLVYPQRSDFQRGDLDLLQLKVSREEGGFWFKAMFKNPVRDPIGVPNSVGAESLANFARKGFYQFNLDIYVDTDRIKGSGNTFTLPGRQMKIEPEYAWEKAVILTPRPELMRQQLINVLIDQYPDRTKAETEASVDLSVFFPTRIKVHGKSISFFVPAGFFVGSDGTDWAITALVTGAMITIPADVTFFPTSKTPLERLELGVMQPASGQPTDTFGYSGPKPSPVVDMLGPSADLQKRELAGNISLTGVSWGPHSVNDIAAATLDAPIAEKQPTVPNSAKPVVPIANLLQPEDTISDEPVEAGKSVEPKPAEMIPPADTSIAKRLQTLQQLFDQKLIDESEYKQQKQRILNDL